MPLTQESFRDPRKQYFVKATSGFYLEGRSVGVGDVVSVSRSIAAELVHSGKGTRAEQPAAPAVPLDPNAGVKPVAKEK